MLKINLEQVLAQKVAIDEEGMVAVAEEEKEEKS